MKDFIKDCLLFQSKDNETLIIGVLSWASLIGMLALYLFYK